MPPILFELHWPHHVSLRCVWWPDGPLYWKLDGKEAKPSAPPSPTSCTATQNDKEVPLLIINFFCII